MECSASTGSRAIPPLKLGRRLRGHSTYVNQRQAGLVAECQPRSAANAEIAAASIDEVANPFTPLVAQRYDLVAGPSAGHEQQAVTFRAPSRMSFEVSRSNSTPISRNVS